MSEPADKPSQPPRRRVPKDPFAVAPSSPPSRPQPAPAPPTRPTPRAPREDNPFRRAPEPERPAKAAPPSSALVRHEEANEARRRSRDPEDEPPRRRHEEVEERPRRSRQTDDAAFNEDAPRRRRREPDEEEERERSPRRREPDEEEEPPRRRREEERDYPDKPLSGRRRHREESPADKVVKPLMRVLKWIRTLLDVATAGYIIALVFLLVTLEWNAEEHIYTASLLYLPPAGWLLPLLVLAPMSLLFWRPWLLPFHALCVAAVFGLYMRYGRNEPVTATGPTVTIVSNNIGENRGKSVHPFVERESPDLIVLQDAAGRGPEYRRVYTNHYIAGVGQFLLISKLPIKKAELVPLGTNEQYGVAACFEVNFNSRPLAVYNVHLPTPRRYLEAAKGLGGLAMLFGKSGGYGETLRADSEAFWANQIKLADALVDHIRQDKRECLIAGDFNAPDHGVVYRLFADKFTDSFRARGQGYGFSFPGDYRTGPWMRLDQIHSTGRLRPVYARTEEGRRSQHRAVVARFEWQ